VRLVTVASREAWESEATAWIAFTRTPGHDAWYLQLNLPRFLEILPPPPRLVVDIGCGEGRLGAELSRRGYDVVGVDSSAPLVRAPAQHPSPVIQADAARLPLRCSITDTATLFMSLQDTDDLDGAVREAGRIVRSGGRVCISVLHPLNTSGRFTT
jgi:SAM-dependent methyltransferase